MENKGLSTQWFANDLEPSLKITKAHLDSIEALTYNPVNKAEIATGGHDKLIKIWDLEKSQATDIMEEHTEGVWSLQFSKDGKTLLSGSPDKTLILWDMRKKKPSAKVEEHRNKVYWASFNENNNLIASGGEDQKLIIWDIRKGSVLKTITSNSKIIYSVKWSLDGKYLLTSEFGGVVKIFDTKNFDLIDKNGKYNENERAWSLGVDFSEGSKAANQVFVGYESNYMKVFSLDNQTKKLKQDYEFYAHMDPVKNVSVNGKRGLFISCCRDGSCRVWETERKPNEHGIIQNKVVANLLEHVDNVACAEFTPDPNENIVATCSWDQNIHLYNLGKDF